MQIELQNVDAVIGCVQTGFKRHHRVFGRKRAARAMCRNLRFLVKYNIRIVAVVMRDGIDLGDSARQTQPDKYPHATNNDKQHDQQSFDAFFHPFHDSSVAPLLMLLFCTRSATKSRRKKRSLSLLFFFFPVVTESCVRASPAAACSAATTFGGSFFLSDQRDRDPARNDCRGNDNRYDFDGGHCFAPLRFALNDGSVIIPFLCRMPRSTAIPISPATISDTHQ